MNKKEDQYSIEDAASYFGVSDATIRNWIKCKHLSLVDGKININDIKRFQELIKTGEVSKLNNRANKSVKQIKFSPNEYINIKSENIKFKNIIRLINEKNQSIDKVIKFLLVNYLVKKNFVRLQNNKIITSYLSLQNEITAWNIDICDDDFQYLLQLDIPEHHDPIGFIYQSIFSEGNKSKQGSYYTPLKIVNGIVIEYLKEEHKVMDPCCGTGQFLIAFSMYVNNPLNIFGFDIDSVAIAIARINIIVQFKDMDFSPNIYCLNSLTEIHKKLENLNYLEKFDLIATNPPWGAHLNKNEAVTLKEIYHQIKSGDSYSYFMLMSISLLKENGILSFILPESFLNVKKHGDLRKWILKNVFINRIDYLGAIFKNVFTGVLRIDLINKKEFNYSIKIMNTENAFYTSQKEWLQDKDFNFNIFINDKDKSIISSVYNIPHITLKNNAKWALGIVTGNNGKYIKTVKSESMEPVITGKDLSRFHIKEPSMFIHYTPEIFQQVPSENLYKADEKIIYRFISKDLVFAYDKFGVLTLNSANVLVPKIDYPIKVIIGLFNSTLYNYIFRKKFASIKVLRGHIEDLPLPLLNKKQFDDIVKLVDEIIDSKSNDYKILDDYIFDIFNIVDVDKDFIIGHL